MCRLMAISDTKHDAPVRRMVMHQLMLYSQADWNQNNGAGVTDGITGRKSPYTYANFGIDWLQHLTPGCIWHGHVRKASRDTALSTSESHPFLYRLHDGSRLFASHNGGVNGFTTRVQGEPDVDSHRAFKELVKLLDDARAEQVTSDIVNAWIDKFGVGSEWTFMLLHKDLLHVIRGNRDMHYATFGNGLIFNTSKDVLLNLKEWMSVFWGENYTMGNIVAIEPWKMVTIVPGKRKPYMIHGIHEQKAPPVVQRSYVVMNDSGNQNIAI